MAAIAENKNTNQEEDEEPRIPVLTVLKNNAILKNVFIILKNEQHTVLIGRHPHCNIVLTHPSVSRFHLSIRSKPSSRTLSIVDLASVHGTWVCGKKLEPGVSVELQEGDTFRVGVSTRVYRLSWVPLTQLDVFVPQEKDEEEQIIKDESLELSVGQEIRMPEDIVSFCCDEERKSQFKDERFGVLNGQNKLWGSLDRVLSPPFVQSIDQVDNSPKIEACPEVEMPGETNLLCTLKEYLTHNICLPVVEAVQGTKMQQFQSSPDTFTGQSPSLEMHSSSLLTNTDSLSFDGKDAAEVAVIPKEYDFGCTLGDNNKVGDILTTGARVLNYENTCLLAGEDIPDCKFHQIEVVEEVSVDSVSDAEKQDECKEKYLQDLDAKSCNEQGYSMDEIVEDNGNKCIDSATCDEREVAAVPVICKESEFGRTLGDDERIERILTTESRIVNSENTSLLDEEPIPVTKFQQIKIVEEVAVDSISKGEKEDKCGKDLMSKLQASLNAKSCHEIAEDTGNRCASSVFSTSFHVESPNCSMPQEAVLNITNKFENQNPQTLTAVTSGSCEMEILENHVELTEKSSTCGNICSRRGKAASAPQARARKSRLLNTSIVDAEVEISNVNNIINKSMPKDLSSALSDEEEIFTPNKENLSPNTYQLRFMRKKGKIEENKHSKSQRSHNWKANFSPNIYLAESINANSNKENQTPKVAQEQKLRRKPLECRTNSVYEQDLLELKKNRVERVPFQSLMNSGSKCKSGTSAPASAAKSIDDSSNCGRISAKYTKPSRISISSRKQKRSWYMVVDTTSLLSKESRKALQLLQGLNRTRLIIPELVIRELSTMKQQFRFSRRTSEASLALEWIEECMEKTRWWIHIQSSMEECRLTAPTPPASPNTLFIEESWTFTGPNSSKECSSPTVEDHILDCALQYRRKENVEQLVLLSDDVKLKIKSMAKGMLCETVQQFRQSLVNPFSERFMWSNSSPRGFSWSCQDDVVLREKYCGLPSKAGLKLIT